ncbi:MAG TPA: alpha-amylase family glycosyl hydrolase, partial [Tepidisphaeraceae bacterium]|nr:alpha-amylase family glycosyl hydrolase [Tepidisphaeraceae bacterium]
IDRFHRHASLRLRFACADYQLTCTYTLRPGKSSLDRAASLTRIADDTASAVTLEGFLFQLPGVLLGSPSDCTVQIPGPFWPDRFIHAGTRYDELKTQSMGFHSAPDAGFGILTLSNPVLNKTLASWMVTAGEVADHPSLQGDKTRLSFRHHDERAYRLWPGMAIDSDVHHVEIVTGPVRAALAAFREMATQTLPLPANSPAWTREAILLEVYPQYFPTGFKGITGKLPFYRDIGFNTLYLMPHWKGGYSPIDPFAVEPALGTEDDLKELVRTAHALGMKVIFDMVIHGFNEKSPFVQRRPDLFCRDEQGKLVRHPAWKSITTDWASPAYQQFMVDLVLHDLKTYDIDGYRVDAATFKGPNWDPAIPYPAYRSGSAAPELIGRMLSAMRQTKPDAAMLSEVFGPLFYTVCDMVHDNQTEAPQFFLEQMEKGTLNTTHYKAHLAAVYDALPAGATRVMFARNHDTSWFYHFNGYTPRFLALDAIHTLFAIPEIFAGDPRHKP